MIKKYSSFCHLINRMSVIISILVGIIQTILFNPIDKAIYNSITNNNSILTPTNWNKPFSGLSNNIYMRIITGGSYFYLLDYTKTMTPIQSALTVSATTSIILNPLNVIKYRSYSDNISTYKSFIVNYKKNGLKFGIISIETLFLRNLIFNYIYISHKTENNDLIHNCGVIGIANIISSPLQYYYNMKYKDNNSYYQITTKFYNDVKINNNKFIYTMKQLGIGYGTIRNCMSLYIGQIMFSTLTSMTYK
jgi:hypothetical protein